MSKFLPSGRSRLALQLCAAAAVAALMGGCSTDSTRLSDPFSNPFTTASNEPVRPTASASHTIPTGRTPPIVSQALPAHSSSVASVAPLRPHLTQAYNAPISRETTGSIEPSPARSARGASFGGWTSTGGVPITVGQSDSADVLSKRYGVPTAALLQTNGLHSAADVRPGSSLVIPVYNAVGTASQAEPARVAQAEPPRMVETAAPRTAHPKPLAKAALLKPKAERAAAAESRANAKLAAHAKPIAEAKVATAPIKVHPAKDLAEKPLSTKTATAKRDVATEKPVPVKQAAVKPAVALKTAPVKTASLAPTPAKAAQSQAAARQPDPTPTASVAPAAPVADASGNPEFRWPARGRIIQGFKGGSGGNDGINIAVPEGTPVKAAEGGTVAYAGSELKGYGNLVLIRHPNGFVSAYANNGELDVKRGDQVKRGQLIAKSGQSGNVSSPQLHFELRKGSTPVDPTSYLAGL